MFNCLEVASLYCYVQLLVRLARGRMEHDLSLHGSDGQTEIVTR